MKHDASLDDIADGQIATVVSVNTSKDLSGYLNHLGLCIGSKVQLVSKASPCTIKIGQSKLGLDKSILEKISVTC